MVFPGKCDKLLYNTGVRKRLGARGEAPFLTLRVSPKLLKTLKALAENDRRSLSDYVRLALEDHIARELKRK